MRVARGDAVALTRELVRIDSRNPSLVPGGPGEGAVARALGEILSEWGFRVDVHDAAPGRPNVVARIGRGGGRSLMFNGHLDVVGTDGMIHDPWLADGARRSHHRSRRLRHEGRRGVDVRRRVHAPQAIWTEATARSSLPP